MDAERLLGLHARSFYEGPPFLHFEGKECGEFLR
jgi:hypothetical protein